MNAPLLFSVRLALSFFFLPAITLSADTPSAATATNEIGIDLYRKLATGEGNLCLSPYSIENALAMTFGGAEGKTREEMARVLHFSGGGETLHAAFGALQRQLEEMSAQSAKRIEDSKTRGGPQQPIILTIANRLFAQKGICFSGKFSRAREGSLWRTARAA